jgi:hypothetical protein
LCYRERKKSEKAGGKLKIEGIITGGVLKKETVKQNASQERGVSFWRSECEGINKK